MIINIRTCVGFIKHGLISRFEHLYRPKNYHLASLGYPENYRYYTAHYNLSLKN